MSLYSLATDLFGDIDKLRAAAPDPTISAKKQSRLVDDEPADRLRVISEGGLPQLRDRRQNGKTEQTPTLELLAGCLRDIHEIRCGARPTRINETKHSCEVQWCHVDDDSDRTSPSCSETSRTGGELIDQDNNNAEGGRTGTMDPATGGGVCATIDSFAGAPSTEQLWSSSSGGQNAGGVGPTTTTRSSTIVHESGAIDESWGHASPRLSSSNDKYSSATDQCAAKPNCVGTDAAANDSYADFEREVTEWSKSAGVGGCQRARTDMAAHLSAKYLCRKLDAMPSSAVVCRLRREVVRRIDLLATETDPHVDGEHNKVIATSRSHSGRNNYSVASGDGDHQAMGHHRTDCGSVPPLLVNERENSELLLASRVTPYRAPPANRGSVDYVGVGPTRHAGRSIQAGQKFPGMKGVGPTGNSSSSSELSRIPAPSFGDLYPTTAKLLPARRGPKASGRSRGEAPSSCLIKRVVRHFPPVVCRDKGGVSSSSIPTRGPRAKAVRFLLRASDGGDSLPSSAGGVAIGAPAQQVEIAKGEAEKNPGNIIERFFWTCGVCGKTNEEGGVSSCTVCGRRQHRSSYFAKAHSGVRRKAEEQEDPAVVVRGEPTRSVQLQQRPESRQEESVRLVSSGDDSVRSDSRKTGTVRGSVAETARKFGGSYDASSFAKMRRETEPAVRARLGLTGEIKSLLSEIRRNG